MSKIIHVPCVDTGYHAWRLIMSAVHVKFAHGRKEHLADILRCEKCEVMKIKRRKHKLTDWYPGDVKPVRVGVYERNFDRPDGERWYSFWDGKHWRFGHFAKHWAEQYKDEKLSFEQRLPWRGIAK